MDSLARVKRLDGKETRLLSHIEVQSQRDPTFEDRMLRYYVRLLERFRNNPLYSLVIYGDDSPAWIPERLDIEVFDLELHFRFPSVKLIKYTEAELDEDPNPFVAVVLAHRQARRTRHDADARKAAKLNLYRRLFRLGYDREKIRLLYKLTDWLLQLPKEMMAEEQAAIRAIASSGDRCHYRPTTTQSDLQSQPHRLDT